MNKLSIQAQTSSLIENNFNPLAKRDKPFLNQQSFSLERILYFKELIIQALKRVLHDKNLFSYLCFLGKLYDFYLFCFDSCKYHTLYTIVRISKMMDLLGFDDNKKIGLVLLALAALLYFLGIILFFARSFLLLSNVLFILGLYFFIGWMGTLKFFTKKGKIKGSIVYFTGFTLITLNFGFFGALAQIAGFVMIFRTFLPDLYDYICKIPVVGHYLKSYWLQNFLDKLAGNQTNRI